jgi:hypothetical protein
MTSYFGEKQIMMLSPPEPFSSLTLSAVSWSHHHDHHSIVLAMSALRVVNSVVEQELDVHPF